MQMDVDRWFREGWHLRGFRVYLDGVDVTDRCRMFDDAAGVVELLPKPLKMDDDGNPIVERRYGKVEIG